MKTPQNTPAPGAGSKPGSTPRGMAGRLAVCSWSLQPENPQALVTHLKATGIDRVQLALDPLRENPDTWGVAPELLERNGISVVSGMLGCVGEDYSTLETIRRTGGIAPDGTWDQNLKNMQAIAAIAHRVGLKLVTFHAGFVPHDQADPGFQKMVNRLREAAAVFAAKEIVLGLETGQETAESLVTLLTQLKCSNIAVNFDPANMILYDKGDPVAALRTLGPWIRQVHIKDARRTKVTGTWGDEVPAGQGEVDWPAFFTALADLRFDGNLVIEREAGTQRVADIKSAKQLVEKLCS